MKLSDWQLTAEQQAAALHAGGHARVMAVAGAGKSTMLMARIAHLLAQGVSPRRIRVLTYNREAAEDFRARLQQRLQVADVQVQTFHALGWRVLQRLAAMRQAADWPLASGGQELSLKRDALRHAGLELDQLESLSQAMEWAKAQAQPFDLTLTQLPEALRGLAPALRRLEQLRQQAGVWFFQDLLYEPWRMLAAQPELRDLFADHLDHLLVDEYQDINEVQHQLLAWLAGTRAQVMVVGDVDQCIYTWRGASPDFLLYRFEQDFPAATTYHLSQTFRFGHALALLANHALAANDNPSRRLVLSAPGAAATRLHWHAGAAAAVVVRELARWQQGGGRLEEAALLVRLWSQAPELELALLSAGIAYRLLGERSVWDHGVTQGIMAVLALASGQLWQRPVAERQSALSAFWQLPPLGMPRAARERLVRLSAEAPDQVAAALMHQPCDHDWLKQHWQQRADVWNWLYSGQAAHLPALALLRQLASLSDLTSRLERLSGTPHQARSALSVWQAMLALLPDGLSAAAAQTHLDGLRQQALTDRDGEARVTLTSIHRVKGREWDWVLLSGLEDAAFPGQRAEDEQQLAEERRLFYVALTRARQQLHLVLPDMDALTPLWQQGQLGTSAGRNCRFVAESHLPLCQRLADYLQVPSGVPPAARDRQLANAYLQAIGAGFELRGPVAAAQGRSVRHDRFGTGILLRTEGDKLEILFDDGVRWLLADHPALHWD